MRVSLWESTTLPVTSHLCIHITPTLSCLFPTLPSLHPWSLGSHIFPAPGLLTHACIWCSYRNPDWIYSGSWKAILASYLLQAYVSTEGKKQTNSLKKKKRWCHLYGYMEMVLKNLLWKDVANYILCRESLSELTTLTCTLNSVTSNRTSKCSRSKRQNTHKYEGKFRVEGSLVEGAQFSHWEQHQPCFVRLILHLKASGNPVSLLLTANKHLF